MRVVAEIMNYMVEAADGLLQVMQVVCVQGGGGCLLHVKQGGDDVFELTGDLGPVSPDK